MINSSDTLTLIIVKIHNYIILLFVYLICRYYSATIIKMSGIEDEQDAIWLAAVVAGVNFLFTILGVWLVEKIGRKRLLIVSMIGLYHLTYSNFTRNSYRPT